MRKRRPISISLLSFIISVLSFTLVSSNATVTMAEPRGEIRIVDNWRPDINVLGHNVLEYLFEMSLDKKELTPSLGLSHEWIEDTTLEIRLRRGVRFTNGEPFNAEAVKFNFDFQSKHNPGRGVQFYMKNVREMEITDSHTIRLFLDQPDFLLLDKIILGPVAGWVIGAPKHMERKGWKGFLKHPIGTGPYVVQGMVKDHREVAEGEVYATLTANLDYWRKGHPQIQKIEFLKYSPDTALNCLLNDRIDLVTSLIPKDTLKVEESPKSKVVKGRHDVRFTAGFLNLRSPRKLPLKDMRVRKALNFAVNKEEMMRYAFKGNAIEMRGVLTKKSGVDLSNTEPYTWNIPKARELLREAGYEEGFRMKLIYHEKDYLIAQFLKRFFSLVNIETEIVSATWEEIVAHCVYPNTREGHSWKNEDWWIIVYSDPGYTPELMSVFFEYIFHSGAAWQHFPGWLMESLDDMYDELLRTKNREERFQIYKKANEYIADQALWVFTLATLGLYGVNEELNFVPQMSQYLYLDYSSVTENHWSLRGKND